MTWTTTIKEQDPGRAEVEIRFLLTNARPVLSGCSHRI